MKIKVNDVRSKMAKRSDKFIIAGTVLKVLLPGTGIGSAISAYGWSCAVADAANNPEAYLPLLMNNQAYEPWMSDDKASVEELAKKTVEFLNKVEEGVEDKHKKDKNNGEESQ